jgi:predicted dehydrogenase
MTTSRRAFLKQTAAAASAVAASQVFGLPNILSARSPNEKLNIAGIGVGGQGTGDLRNCATTENIVALADVDWARASGAFSTWDSAKKYKDFREMLDKEGKNIDAVVIATPDHMHAHAALACMQRGKHVYVEKPLTRTPWEARLLKDAAEKYKVATQMGNQGYSHDATRVAAEIVWSGEIGEVKEVHAWTGRASWPQGMTKVPPPTPVPETLDWDLWLGGAPERPFTAGDEEYRSFITARSQRGGRGSGRRAGEGGQEGRGGRGGEGGGQEGRRGRGGGGGFGGGQNGFYLPFNWRGFYDFGTGLIGDWGVHILGPANWALQLAAPTSVECIHKDSTPPFTFPDELTIKYEFAARDSMPPVSVYWYHKPGGDAYLPEGMTAAEARKIAGTGPQVGPAGGGRGGLGRRGGGRGGAEAGTQAEGARGEAAQAERGGRRGGRGGGGGGGSGYNCIFVGSKGYLGTSGRGEGVGLLPGAKWAEYTLPQPFLSRSPGASSGSNHSAHCRDWIRACKGGAPACSNFSIAGPYTEWLVLGAIAVRVDGKLEWDAANLRFKNSDKANELVKPVFRKGWEISLT